MGTRLFLSKLFLILSFAVFADNAAVSFDKALYYKSFMTKDLTTIEAELTLVQSSVFPEKEAYEGALLMKKAGIVSSPKNKLSLFKDGHKKLENAISKSQSNVEYRFLRLMIQENAPGILNYNDDMLTDSKIIKTSYQVLPVPVLQAIKEYSKTSDHLKPADFQ